MSSAAVVFGALRVNGSQKQLYNFEYRRKIKQSYRIYFHVMSMRKGSGIQTISIKIFIFSCNIEANSANGTPIYLDQRTDSFAEKKYCNINAKSGSGIFLSSSTY